MNFPRPASFRAKKIVRWRTIFKVEEPVFFLRDRLLFNIVVYAILAALLVGIAVAQGTPPAYDPRKDLSDITSALQGGKVASLVILHMPDRIETRASVTPENLERWFGSKVEIAKLAEWDGREDLLRILRETKLGTGSRMADMRSAIIFNGLDGKRVGTLYIGRYFGRYIGQFGGADGAIGNTPIKFQEDLSAWLKLMIPSPLR